MADAEDVVQDASIRWLNADRAAIREPAAFLQTIVTRLCLNELKSARRQRMTYIGPWLPEPIFDPEEGDSVDDLTLPLMIALERLTPLERAAFLLHDVFGLGFDEVARTLGRKLTTCRKLASRARTHVHDARPRFPAAKDEGLRLAGAFFDASRTGDLTALRAMLADDVTAYTDGGGEVSAPSVPLIGVESVVARFKGLAKLFARYPSRLIRVAMVDGLPGFVSVEDGELIQTTALEVDAGQIVAIYVVRNPEKLRATSRLFGQAGSPPNDPSLG